MSRRSTHIRRHRDGAVDVQVLPWDIDSVVSLQGSWSVPTAYAASAGLELDLLAALLDKGTQKRDKLGISELLERVGASISFSAGSGKIHVAARCLAPDLPLVLDLIREQVEQPSLPIRELELLKGRMKAHLHRQRSDPAAVCRNEMSRAMFGPDHPHREVSFDDLARLIDAFDVNALADLHGSADAWKGLHLAIVGDVTDVDPAATARTLLFRTPAEEAFRVPRARFLQDADPVERHIPIPDRTNLNVLLGHPVDAAVTSEDYLPLWVGVFILGGNFSSRLMSIVRDERGLTYGIRSALGYAGRMYGGAWTTSVTLSQDRLEEGILATREVIERFVQAGVTRAELDERIDTLVGSYEVELATTSGLAARMVQNMSRGREPEYLDSHPETLRALSCERMNAAIARHLDTSRLSLINAGTMGKG